jgi:hypothetical protein
MIGIGIGIDKGSGTTYRNKWVLPIGQSGSITLPSSIVFSCASTRTCQSSPTTFLTGIGANQPVICYNPVVSAYVLQHEEARTNYATYSSSFSNWTNAGCTINNNGLPDPTGSSGAFDISSNQYGLYVSYGNGSTSITSVSCWVQKSTPSGATSAIIGALTASVAYEAGVAITPTSNWQRVSSTLTHAVLSDSYSIVSDNRASGGSGASRANYFGFQREVGYPTSYIPTSSTPVSRSTSLLYTTIGSFSNFKLRSDYYPYPYAQYVSNSYLSYIFEGDTTNRFQLAMYINKLQWCINGIYHLDSGFTYTWSAGDLLSFRLSYDGTTYRCVSYKNGVYQYTHTLVAGVSTGNSSNKIYFGSSHTGAYHTGGNNAFIGAT